MFSVINNSKDIFFNLALEEFLLRSSSEEFFMIWQSETAVVVGKHQNLMAEVNHAFTRNNNIPLARRISGGGTVFHGPGNLNFSFIRNGEPGKMVDFKGFVSPIIDFLKSCGITAGIGDRNDLLIEGKKISGNAEHVYKNRVLHHGTLLYSADLGWLNESIRVEGKQYIGKAVLSNRAEVCNISDFLKEILPVDQFSSALNQYLIKTFPGTVPYEITDKDRESVLELKLSKYIKPDWIYGYSPPFELLSFFRFNDTTTQLKVWVEKGRIMQINFISETGNTMFREIAAQLTGTELRYEPFSKVLTNMSIAGNIQDEILRAVF